MIKEDTQDELFESFIAGILLTRIEIPYLELCKLQCEFENYYGISLDDSQDIYLPIAFRDRSIALDKSYDEYIEVNKKRVKVSDYLYSITSAKVREYFKLDPVVVKRTLIQKLS